MTGNEKTALIVGASVLGFAVLLPALARAMTPVQAPAPAPGSGGGRNRSDSLDEARGWTSFAFDLAGDLFDLGKRIYDWTSDGGGGSYGGGSDISEDPSDGYEARSRWKND